MEQKNNKSLIAIIVLLFLNSSLIFSQTINAGSNQIINWDKTHSAQLNESVTSDEIKVKWTCPQNAEVIFKDASNPITEVTFPRPGYYLLYLLDKSQLALCCVFCRFLSFLLSLRRIRYPQIDQNTQ